MNADVQAAYASCERAARAHYENFPVASMLVPRAMRRHISAVYAFARAADDFADEGTLPAAERLRLLDRWEERLYMAESDAGQPAAATGEPENAPAIFVALAESIRDCALPVALFTDLLSAFRQDVTVTRYDEWDSLLDYCRRSANPVGRLVLRIAGYRDARLDAWSDAICTALQLTNFWQDVKVDLARGRVYLPQSLLEQARVEASELGSRVYTPGLKRALDVAAGRTRDFYLQGRPLCDAVAGRLRYELRATWLGGFEILDRVDRQRVGRDWARPTLRVFDLPALAWRAIAWSAE